MVHKFLHIIWFLSVSSGLSHLLAQADPDLSYSSIQVNSDSINPVDLYASAKKLFDENNLIQAETVAREALQLASSTGNEETELMILSLLSGIQKKLNYYENAVIYCLQAVNILETLKDTMRLIHAYNETAGNFFRLGIFDKSREYYRKALDILPERFALERIAFLENMGFSALYEGEADSAIIIFSRQSQMMRQAGRDDTKALYNLIKAYNNAGKYEGALKSNQLLFERFTRRNEYDKMSSVKNNMAYNLALLGRYPEAISEYLEALRHGIRAGIDSKDHALLLTNTGICYQNAGNSREALRYFRNALKILEASQQLEAKGRVEHIISKIYYHEGDLYNANLYCRQAIESLQKAGDADQLAQSYLLYSRILRDGNDPIAALEYYERYLSLNDSLQFSDKINEEKLSGLKLQLEKSEKELSLKTKGEQLRKMTVQQLTLQLEKEEREKELLQREADLDRLEKERLEQEIQIARQRSAAEEQEKIKRQLEWQNQLKDAQIKQDSLKQISQKKEIESLEAQKKVDQLSLEQQRAEKKMMTWISLLLVLVALSVLGGLITTRRKNLLLARQKKEIEQQNIHLEQKNEEISTQRDEIESQRDLLFNQKQQIEQIHSEITKSIEYARKIQASTLPDLELLAGIAREYFVFFKPRDIVSGDFYWFSNVENTTVIAVADCTGHGVPGAFMSILGISLLKETVLKEYITQPAVILRRLRKEIIAALSQKGVAGEQKDGMDMSLISINRESKKIEYAGAYNSVYIIREKNKPAISNDHVSKMEKDDYILYNLHADKMPIGLYERMERFTNHEFQYEEGDQIYMFTDGYADQFGGPYGKKFMYRPFMNMLLSNAHYPMEKQKLVLSETLINWSGDLAQVDDICILGIKL